MKEHIQSYLDWKAGHTRKAPISYRPLLERFAQIVNKPVGEVNLDDIAHYEYLLKLKYENSFVRYQIVVVRGFIDFCFEQGWTSLHAKMIRAPRGIEKKRTVVEACDFEAMFELYDEWTFNGLQRKLILALLWNTGVRVSELCDLNVADIDPQKRFTQITTKKNGQLRWVMWKPETHDLLVRYLGSRLALNQRQALFITLRGRERVTVRTIQRWVEEARREAGISKQISPHSFRHGFAHRVVGMGGSIKELQVLLGHSAENPMASFHYIRLDQKEALAIAEKYT